MSFLTLFFILKANTDLESKMFSGCVCVSVGQGHTKIWWITNKCIGSETWEYAVKLH